MRNKLKQRKKRKDGSPCLNKNEPRTVITLMLSESSCFNDDISANSLEAKHTHGSTAAAAAADICGIEVQPIQEQRKKDLKIAPVFLFLTQQHKSNRSREVESDRPVERLQQANQSEEDVQLVESQPRLSAVCRQTNTESGQLLPSVLRGCLQEIQTSNQAFPASTVFRTLQKRARERLKGLGSTGYLCSLLSKADNSPDLSSLHLKEKRKRGSESSERVPPKRPRLGLAAEGATGSMGHCHTSVQHGPQESTVSTGKKQPRSNKLSRSRRLRQQSGSPAGLGQDSESYNGLVDHTDCYSSQSVKTSDTLQGDSSFEDVLWTDKYSLQHSGEVIGNSASVNKLQSWLKKWKLRADCYERRKEEERKREENSNDSWDCGDFQGEAGVEDEGEEPPCNTMLITGPPGVGKTASVYACSQELGFKVFEVNCSSQRSGRHVLSQLKEATQSHLVEMSGKDPLKPTYLNNYGCAPKSDPLPVKTVPPKKVNSTSKKRAAHFPCSSRKGKAHRPSVTLANYFKMKAKADHLHNGGPLPCETSDCKKSRNLSPGYDGTVPQNRKMATSLILFEEVDVIFDDDVGFLAAIKAFMITTKRPVILTTNDPSFRERFKCSLEIIFRSPSAVNVCSYLQLVGLAENVRLDLDDVRSLLRLLGGDVRRCLLQLQLWVHSGGGRASQSRGLPKETTHTQHSNITERGDDVEPQLPPCDSGCTVSMLGLYPVTQTQLLNLLKCQFWSEMETLKLLRLLAESWRGGVPLLYSNLELLLPIGPKLTSLQLMDKGTGSGPRSEPAHSGNINPKVSAAATDSKPPRNISRLSRKKQIPTVLDATTPFSSSTQTTHRASLSREEIEQNVARVATDSLDAMADFFDLMSYLDATVVPATTPQLVKGSCKAEMFVWTGAEIKDGMLDEMREDEERSSSSRSLEMLLDIQAAVEGLGCHRCCWRVSEAWTKAQIYRQEWGDDKWGGRPVETLILPAYSKRQSLCFSFQPLCTPIVSKRRYELSRRVLGMKAFSLLGNRQAVSVDYLPVLRYICRLQREEPTRCQNFLRSIHMDISKSTVQLLAEDFS